MPQRLDQVIANHSNVAAHIWQAFEVHWTRATPHDRDRPVFNVGHPADPETYLHPSDWYLPSVP